MLILDESELVPGNGNLNVICIKLQIAHRVHIHINPFYQCLSMGRQVGFILIEDNLTEVKVTYQLNNYKNHL